MHLRKSKHATKQQTCFQKKQDRAERDKASTVRFSSIVPAMMLQSDILSLILDKLDTKQILLCSLVCRSFLQHIDDLHTNYFNNSLRWWSVYGHVEHEESSLLRYNDSTQQYEHLLYVSQHGAQNWTVNIRPIAGSLVNMRISLHLPLQHVHMTGRANSILSITERQFASIDALEWKILSIEKSSISSQACKGKLAKVSMQVTSFVHNNKLVTLQMEKPIIVVFANVPLADTLLCPRVLCVIKCIRQCMHCHQRFAKWRSYDNVAANHRALCAICKDELYVNQKHIASKWKILDLPATVDSFHFMQFGIWQQNPKFCLKKDIAAILGHETWEQMLRKNRFRNAKRKTLADSFAHFDFSNRYFLY